MTAGGTLAGEDLLDEFTQAQVGTPFGAEGEQEEAQGGGSALPASPPAPGMQMAGPAPAAGVAAGETQADPLSLTGTGLGADDLLSALRLEAMREKKKDDTSLVRSLKGVKVTGKELLAELDSLVRNMRAR